MTRTMMVIAAFGLVVGSPLGAAANDEPDSLVACRIITVRPGLASGFGATLRLVCDGDLDLPDEPANDPLIEGGTLRVFDLGGSAGDDTYDLPAANWSRRPSNPLNPLRGFKYFVANPSPTLPCRRIIVRKDRIKALCKHQGMTLTPPFSGDAAVVLTIGTNSKRYCARLGGRTRFNQVVLSRSNAPAPTECSSPSGAFLEVGAALVE